MGIVRAICTSKKRGTAKTLVDSARLTAGWGIEGDAHAGYWHRQVSLLGFEEVEQFRAKGANVKPGSFGENLLVEGLDLAALAVGAHVQVGPALLEVTQIGKECHNHCEIYDAMGECIMPSKGVFARVLTGGGIAVGDAVTLPDGPSQQPAPWRAAVLTLSDAAAAGNRTDESGPAIQKALKGAGFSVEHAALLPDDRPAIEKQLAAWCDEGQLDVIFTTGGTGFAKRDVTPEATLAVATRNAPGIAEAIRAHSIGQTPRAMFGRGASVLRGQTLIVNLPGSPKAVKEILAFLLPQLPHALAVLRGPGS